MPVKEQRTLRRVVIRDTRKLAPFNEEARDLRILNKRLWLHQRDVLAPYSREGRGIDSIDEMPADQVVTLTGSHDWPTWRILLTRLLENRLLRRGLDPQQSR